MIKFISFVIVFCFNSCAAQKTVLERDENGKIYKELVINDEKSIIKAYFIPEVGDKIEIAKQVKVEAVFFEGEDKLEQFIEDNLHYPKNFELHGKLTFVILIDSLGNMNYIRLLKKSFDCTECMTNALEVINKMKWIAAKNEMNEHLTSLKYLTIKFK
jgi:hypothetical protein